MYNYKLTKKDFFKSFRKTADNFSFLSLKTSHAYLRNILLILNISDVMLNSGRYVKKLIRGSIKEIHGSQ